MGFVEFSTFRVTVVEVEAAGPSDASQKSDSCAWVPVVEAYVRRSILLLEVFVLVEAGGQVKVD